MKKLLVVLLITMFATTGIAFAKNEANTTTKAKTETTTQAKVKSSTGGKEMHKTKETPKGIATASMEGQGKKKGLMEKWFGWMTPKSEKATNEAGKAEKEQKKTKTEKQTKGKSKTGTGKQK